MNIHIPAWLLWTTGALVGVVIIGCAVFGVMAWFALREQQRSLGRWFGW